MTRSAFAALALCFSLTLAACNDDDSPTEPDTPMTFTVTLEVPASSPSPIAPGVFVVHTSANPIFARGEVDRGQGLEALAEDGDPSQLAQTVGTAFDTPTGASSPAPATPGGRYQFSFAASPGDRLSFATMHVQSNDAFYAPDPGGLALFNGSSPVTGDVTDRVMLWDAGTEVNQEPGVGTDQAPRQAGPNTGAMESAGVDLVDTRDSFDYGSAIRVTISAM